MELVWKLFVFGILWFSKDGFDFVWILWVFGLLYGYKFVQFLGFN